MGTNKDYLVIPTTSGLLDCFNTKKSRYSKESICYIKSASEINIVFIITLFSYIYHYCDRAETDTYIIILSKLKQFRGQKHGSKGLDIRAELQRLSNIDCYFENLDIDKLLIVEIEGRTAIIHSKYFSEIYKAMSILTKRDNGKQSSSFTSLISTEILTERNHSAVEITIEICKLVERRGFLTEGQTAHIAITTLIDRCPTLSIKINKINKTSRKNEILREDLNKATEFLQSKTRIYEVFEGLEIDLPERIAVNKEAIIMIKHRGRIINYE